MAGLNRPWGRVKSFEFHVGDRKLDDQSPYEVWISLNLWMEEAEAPPFTVTLALPPTADREQFEAACQRAEEIETLLRDHVTGVSLDTFV